MTMSRTPRAASSRANARPAMPAPTMTTEALDGGSSFDRRRPRPARLTSRRRIRLECRRIGLHEVAEAHRPKTRARRRDRAASRQAGERLETRLALAWAGQGTGSSLDEFRVAVARGQLGPDLPDADILAE